MTKLEQEELDQRAYLYIKKNNYFGGKARMDGGRCVGIRYWDPKDIDVATAKEKKITTQ